MSGYSSKAEAMKVLRETLPDGGRRHYIGRVFDELFYDAGAYGWRLTDYSEEFFWDVARRHERARPRAPLTRGRKHEHH